LFLGLITEVVATAQVLSVEWEGIVGLKLIKANFIHDVAAVKVLIAALLKIRVFGCGAVSLDEWFIYMFRRVVVPVSSGSTSRRPRRTICIIIGGGGGETKAD
jgi:hypothetical protein